VTPSPSYVVGCTYTPPNGDDVGGNIVTGYTPPSGDDVGGNLCA
jgi:hypothetical protein